MIMQNGVSRNSLGLQRPMVLTTWQWQRSRSTNDVVLQSWRDSEATAAVYQELGLELHAHFIAYFLELAY